MQDTGFRFFYCFRLFRSVTKFGNIFPKLIMALSVCYGPTFHLESKAFFYFFNK